VKNNSKIALSQPIGIICSDGEYTNGKIEWLKHKNARFCPILWGF
jgi:hypothetical protein